MIKIAFFDTKPYDKIYFENYKKLYDFQIDYFEPKLDNTTAYLTKGYNTVVAFVNDTIDSKVIDILVENNIKLLSMRCAGYNNVDIKNAYGRLHIATVPAYSPYSVAEHAMALLLTLNRKTHRAYLRIKEHNFSLNGLMGFDLNEKTIGVIGTGKIGRVFIDICKGFNMNIIAYDPYPVKDSNINYVTLDELFEQSDIISLHCPLTKNNYHMINKEAINKMKDNVIIINTSRGALINSIDLLEAIRNKKIGAAGLDVYEEENNFFYEDMSLEILSDEVLGNLITMPNVLITSHQAFLTKDALENIAKTALFNINEYFNEHSLTNEICYRCSNFGKCTKKDKELCF